MAQVRVPADSRVQVVTQDLLESRSLTIRNDEAGTDARVYGSETDEGPGMPLRTDDELRITEGDNPRFGDSDGIWIETETNSSTTLQILKDVALVRNVRRKQDAEIKADTTDLLKSSDQPLDVSDAPVPIDNLTTVSDSATTTSTGSANAAQINVPDGRSTITAAYDVSGACDVTVEVSPDGNTWYQHGSVSPGGATTGTIDATSGFNYARIYVSANINSASIGAKGA